MCYKIEVGKIEKYSNLIVLKYYYLEIFKFSIKIDYNWPKIKYKSEKLINTWNILIN